MRTTLLFCSLSLIAPLLIAQGRPDHGFGIRGHAFGASKAPVTGAPYSGVETIQTQQLLANGNQINHSEQSNIYRDSQGRTRTERTVTPPASSGKVSFTEVTLVDPVAGYRYEWSTASTTAFQSPLPPPRTGGGTHPPPPANPNVTTASLGTQTINGVSAAGTQVTETIPAGAFGNAQPIQVVRIRWISTDLKIPVQIKMTDPRFGTRDLEVTSIVEAEPAASLFAVPSGYTIQTGHGGFPGPGHPR